MAIILFDDDFYEENNFDGYINELISFIEKYFDLDVSVFHPFCNIGNSWSKQNMLAVIQLKLQKLGKLEIFDKNLICPMNDTTYSCLEFSPEFIGEINYLLSNFNDVIIPVTLKKHKLKIKTPHKHIYIINNIYEEVDSNIAFFINNDMFITNILLPTRNSPLPNQNICKKYYNTQNKLIKEGQDKFDVFSTIAKEVAYRNNYTYNKLISLKNKTKEKRRDIYDYNKEQYLSTDFETGCFEVYNSRGKHQGEYSYTNKQISPPDKTGKHDIDI